LVVSLTTTPMMCSLLLKKREDRASGTDHLRKKKGFASGLSPKLERGFDKVLRGYDRSLGWVLRHPLPVLLVFLATIALNVWLYTIVPKGFFPQQDTGRMIGFVNADQSISFQAMRGKL